MNQTKNKLFRVIGTIEKKEWIERTKNYKITLARKNIFFFTRRGERIKKQLVNLEQGQKYLFWLKESSKYLFLVNYQIFIDQQLRNFIQQIRQQNEENLLRLQGIYRFVEKTYWEIQSKVINKQELSPREVQQKEILVKIADLFSLEIF
ncbi:MAG: hypothetical protein MRECE_2c101 [Mycoplasmataceae bacterium CE_OT135]|nr:MAG: hypothetical protein MRECE_2c101 [Mycoplasmataceae bacterium CE_OT135]